MKKRDGHPESSNRSWAITMCEIIKGGALAGIISIFILFLCAIMVSMGVLPVHSIEGVVLVACILGALIGASYEVCHTNSSTLLIGIGVGLVLFLLLFTAGFIVYDGISFSPGGIKICCACLCGGAVPGILGRKPKKKRRR